MYHDKIGFLTSVNTRDILVRTSTEDRTQQVAGGLLFGMDPSTAGTSWPLHTQPENVLLLTTLIRSGFYFSSCPNRLIRSHRIMHVPMLMISEMRTSRYPHGRTISQQMQT